MIIRKGVTAEQTEDLYRNGASIVDHLPWVEALEGEKAILLEDGKSVGTVFEIKPKATEGRTNEFLTGVRDTIESAVMDVFPEYDQSPWVFQTYTFNERDLSEKMQQIRDYVKPAAKGTQFTETYLGILERHYKSICKQGGIFKDERVTHQNWGGQIQKNYLVVYRRYQDRYDDENKDRTPLEALNEVCGRMTSTLGACGIGSRRLSGVEFHRWMRRWFNKFTEESPDNSMGLIDQIEEDEELPVGNRFSESLMYCHPESNMDEKYWRFDQTYSRCISMEGLKKKPDIAQSTGEITRNEAINTMMDQLPESAVMVSTTVVVPQDVVSAHIDNVDTSAVGTTSEALETQRACAEAKEILSQNKSHKLYRGNYAFYLFSNSLKDLNVQSEKLRTILLGMKFRVTGHRDDIRSLDNYITNLPMKYDSEKDRKNNWNHCNLMWSQHIANLSSFYGRSTGTGRPGILQVNRGGEPIMVDPMNASDRQKNAHMFIAGPTGAGKSSYMGSMLSHYLAIYRPRVFIIEAGNSFGLKAQWYESQGLTVNAVNLKPGKAPALPVFRDAQLLIGTGAETAPIPEDESDEEDDERDILGELEITATLMITGGEKKEIDDLWRADRRIIRDAILLAAKNTQAIGKETLTEDIRDALFEIADSTTEGGQRIRNMGKSIGLFCDGFTGDVFNKPSNYTSEADVTLIDLGQFAKTGYEAHLSLAVIGVLNIIAHLAERDQNTGREIIAMFDESHLITKHELLADHVTNIGKMGRKLGLWLWLGTQNLQDFPNIARKLLTMMEWWILLTMEKDEVTDVERFKDITTEQKAMILSTAKVKRQYTEGVILSSNHDVLFRTVPPSAMLSLVMTEGYEKSERRELMSEHGVTELEAAFMVADKIDQARGLAC